MLNLFQINILFHFFRLHRGYYFVIKNEEILRIKFIEKDSRLEVIVINPDKVRFLSKDNNILIFRK